MSKSRKGKPDDPSGKKEVRPKKAKKPPLYLPRPLELGITAALATKPVGGFIAAGPAGTGKSAKAEELASKDGAKLIFHQLHPGSREDDLLYNILPSDKTESGMKTFPGCLPRAAQASQKGLVYLVLDEFDKSRPSVDAFMLDFLQNGRVTAPGFRVAANLQNLRVILTMNDERALSEPLLRRLPRLDFPNPTPAIVRQALNDTHSGHPQIPSCVVLYLQTLAAGVSKPATIQELRQLLDAITLLGAEADWSTLVLQFVTKDVSDHAKTMQINKSGVEAVIQKMNAALTAGKKSFTDAFSGNLSEVADSGYQASLPLRDWQRQEFPFIQMEEPLGEETTLVIPFNPESYTSLLRVFKLGETKTKRRSEEFPLAVEVRSSPADLGDLEVVQAPSDEDESGGGEFIVSHEEIPLRYKTMWTTLACLPGAEIVVSETGKITAEEVMTAAEEASCEFHRVSTTEIVGRDKHGNTFRWSDADGMEFVITGETSRCFAEHCHTIWWGTETIQVESSVQPKGRLAAKEWRRLQREQASKKSNIATSIGNRDEEDDD